MEVSFGDDDDPSCNGKTCPVGLKLVQRSYEKHVGSWRATCTRNEVTCNTERIPVCLIRAESNGDFSRVQRYAKDQIDQIQL